MAEEAARPRLGASLNLPDKVDLVPTKRFSPGFGDLPLELQDTFLQAIDAASYSASIPQARTS